MRKTKTEKAITLIALIITIVVLLILAVVAINSITNDGILGKAESAANKYNQAVNDEKEILDYYEGYLAGTLWEQDGTTVTRKNTDGTTTTLTVGQTVTEYTSPEGTTDPGWAVLGVENGKLLLVSKVNVGSIEIYVGESTNSIIESLNNICVSYFNSDLADKARSINVEDINRVTGYKPEEESNYKATATYTMNSEGNIVYTINGVSGVDENHWQFDDRWTGKDTHNGEVCSLVNTYYGYSGSNYLDNNTDAYNVLFDNTSPVISSYILADGYMECGEGRAESGVRMVRNGQVSGFCVMESEEIYCSNDFAGVRAVVALKAGAIG